MTSPARNRPHRWPRNGQVFGWTMAGLLAVALAVILWQLTTLLLLIFASTLAAIIFHTFADMLRTHLRLPFPLALLLAVLLPLTAVVVVFALFGSALSEQFALLVQALPSAIDWLETWLQSTAPGREALSQVQNFVPPLERIFGVVQTAVANVGTALSGLALVLVAGVYLAAQPRLYIDGILGLFPPRYRGEAERTGKSLYEALLAWLRAQVVGMAFVAVGTGVGLWLVGLPAAGALGLAAGLCEFVPYLGVILVSLPAVLIAFSQGVETGWLTVGVLVVVQQVQGNLVSPMVQKAFADLPPALTIFSLIAGGALMGPLGVVFAVPLTVVGLVLLRALMARIDPASAPAAEPEAGEAAGAAPPARA